MKQPVLSSNQSDKNEPMISMQITPQGGVQMLQDDAVDLTQFGTVQVERASHVEFCNQDQGWYVESAKTGKRLASGFKTRGEAITWEKNYYSPSGAGWAELTQEAK